ncbi:MAG: hypothetical protein ACI4BH_07265 [Muribaculaceae bacterium]
MKKKFLNFFMIGALTMASSVGVVSCSDYDDDIDQINEQIKSDKATFNQQLAALQTALEQAKKDAATAAAAAEEAAKKYAEAQAAGALDEAKVYAETVAKEEAKAAAAAAKAEAIEEAKKLIEAAILECKNACSENMAALRNEMIAAIATAQAEANGYTDEQIAQLTSTILDKIAEAEKAGNAYTDAEIAKLHEQITAEIAAKIDEKLAEQYAQVTADINAAIEAGKGYTDQQIEALSVLLGARIDGIEEGLDLLNADENTEGSIKYQIAKAKADLQVQIDALAKYADLLDDLSKTYPALKDAVAQNTRDIDALKTQLDSAKSYLEGLISNLQGELNDLKPLVGKVDGIETRVAAIEGQITTLQGLVNDLTSRLGTLESTVGAQGQTISELQTTVGNLGDAIAAANTLIGNNTQSISDLKTELTNIKSTLESMVSADVTTIHTLVMKRLTSMQYIPNYFIGGIETILFENFEYVPQINNEEGVLAAAIVEGEGDALEAGTIYKPLDTEVNYRLNPSGVDESTLDLAAMKFMCSTAITRAGEEVIAPIADTWTIENGSVLKFKVKQVAENLRNGVDDVVDIVCLQMPLKGAALAKGETEAYVYSDYAQVRSTAEKVKFFVGSALEGKEATSALPIYMNPDSIKAFSDPRQANEETTIYQVEVPMAGEINLADSVCVIMQHEDQTNTVWTKADLERAGFTVTFAKPEGEYKPEGSSQDHMQYLKEVTPEGKVTFDNATAAKGRTPVVRCRVMDGEQVVTEAYFRLKIGGNVVVKLAAEATLVLSSEPNAMTMNLSVDELTEKFYEVLGITQGELQDVANWTMSVESEGNRIAASWFKFDADGNYALTIPVNKNQPTWKSTKVWANTELGGVANNYGSERETTATVKFKSNNGDELSIDFTMNIVHPYYTIGYLETPWVGGIAGIKNYDNPKLVDEGVIMANPSPFSTQYGNNSTTKYVFNVYDGFNMNSDATAPKVKVTDTDANELCAPADIDTWLAKGYGFNWTKPEVDYMVETTREKALEYYLPEVAADNKADNTIENAVDYTAIGATGNWGVNVARTYIEGCESDDAVKPEFKLNVTLPISVIVDGELADQMVIGKYSVRFVKPLHIAGIAGNSWRDALHEKQTLKFAQLINITDWLGQVVNVRDDDQYKTFYNVEYCDFECEEVDGIKVAKVTTSLYDDGLNVTHKEGYDEGKLPTNVAVIVNSNGDLEYQNSGNLTQMPYDIYVPVSIDHKWGKETVKVKVRINKH